MYLSRAFDTRRYTQIHARPPRMFLKDRDNAPALRYVQTYRTHTHLRSRVQTAVNSYANVYANAHNTSFVHSHKWNMLPPVLTGIVICFGVFLSLPGTLACNLSTDRDVIGSLFFGTLTMSPAMGLEKRCTYGRTTSYYTNEYRFSALRTYNKIQRD